MKKGIRPRKIARWQYIFPSAKEFTEWFYHQNMWESDEDYESRINNPPEDYKDILFEEDF